LIFACGLFAPIAHLSRASAAELPLIRITSNATSIVFDFAAVIDDATGAIQGMSLYQNGERVRYNTFDQVKRGITILKVSRLGVTVEVTRLRGTTELDSHAGGELVLTMLRDVLSHDYRDLHLDVVPTSDGKWAIEINEKSGRVPLDRLYMKGYKLLGQPRGVGSVTAYEGNRKLLTINTKELVKD
jgi:hypothetical protein